MSQSGAFSRIVIAFKRKASYLHFDDDELRPPLFFCPVKRKVPKENTAQGRGFSLENLSPVVDCTYHFSGRLMVSDEQTACGILRIICALTSSFFLEIHKVCLQKMPSSEHKFSRNLLLTICPSLTSRYCWFTSIVIFLRVVTARRESSLLGSTQSG